MLTAAELERRKPVWTALSELWLDTELEEAALQRIADTLAASGYSVAELHEIYLYEVAPVVGRNLQTVAGEWAGFDEQWLHAEARERAAHRSLWLRLRLFLRGGRGVMTYATERDSDRLVSLLATPSDADR